MGFGLHRVEGLLTALKLDVKCFFRKSGKLRRIIANILSAGCGLGSVARQLQGFLRLRLRTAFEVLLLLNNG